MPNASTVVYRDLDYSPALTESIEKKITKLNRFSSNIFSSRVVLDTPRQHSQPNTARGKIFSAQLDIDVNGHPVSIHKDSSSIHTAVKEVFKAAETKLKTLNSKTKNSRSTPLTFIDPRDDIIDDVLDDETEH